MEEGWFNSWHYIWTDGYIFYGCKKIYIGDRLLIGTGVGQLLVYDIKEPLGILL